MAAWAVPVAEGVVRQWGGIWVFLKSWLVGFANGQDMGQKRKRVVKQAPGILTRAWECPRPTQGSHWEAIVLFLVSLVSLRGTPPRSDHGPSVPLLDFDYLPRFLPPTLVPRCRRLTLVNTGQGMSLPS